MSTDVIMNRIIIFVLALIALSAGIAPAGDISCWYSGTEGFSEHLDCLERSEKGLRVKQPHLSRLQFDGTLAAVYSEVSGWMYMNRAGDVVISGVQSVDNGPDAFSDGFVRYLQKGKCGYAAADGEGLIAPQFDGCRPFKGGIARVCIGCSLEPVGEHQELRGGEWFCIDKKGSRVECAQ